MKQHTPLHLRLSQPLQHFHLHQKRGERHQPNGITTPRKRQANEANLSVPKELWNHFFEGPKRGRSETSASQNLRLKWNINKIQYCKTRTVILNFSHLSSCVHHVSSVMTFGDSPEPALQFSSSSARSSRKHSIVAVCQDVPKWLKNVSAGPLSDDNLALNHHLHKACFGTQHLLAA